MFNIVQSFSNIFKNFQSFSNMFNHVQLCSIIFNHVQSCSHLKMKQNPIKHDKSRICHSAWAVLHHLHLPTPWRPPRGRLLGPSRRSRKPGGSASDLPKKLQKNIGDVGVQQKTSRNASSDSHKWVVYHINTMGILFAIQFSYKIQKLKAW